MSSGQTPAAAYLAPEPVDLPPPGEGLGVRLVRYVPGVKNLSREWQAVVAGVASLLLIAAGAGLALLFKPLGILVGVLTGALVAFKAPAVRALFRPLAALGRAALPLLLPLLVFAGAGVVNSPLLVQIAVGLVVSLVAWYALIKPDSSLVERSLEHREPVRATKRATLRVAIPLVAGGVALVFLGFVLGDLLDETDGWASGFFSAAAVALAAAAVLRLEGYARTLFRGLVALAVLLLLARLAVEVGLLPGYDILKEVPTQAFAIGAGVVLLIAALVEVGASLLARDAERQLLVSSDELPLRIRAAVALETPITANWVTDRAGALGLLLSGVSAALLLCAVGAAFVAGGKNEDVDATSIAVQSPTIPSGIEKRDLAAMFSPVLLFTEDQRWTPIAVDDYIRGAKVKDWEGREWQGEPIDSVEDLDTDCPGIVRSPCYVMEQACAEGEDKARCAEGLPDDKAVYMRVARKEDWAGCKRGERCADGSPNPFVQPPAEPATKSGMKREIADTTTLLQYWYFYPYNEWIAPVVVGNLKQTHAADWEAVTIGLSETSPLWVAYSAHCGGTFVPWNNARVSESDRRRPLVAVAYGSQANYRAAKASRVPNFAQCSGIPKDRLNLASYAANIRDRTNDSTTWEPAASDLHFVTADMPPMSFPGRWAPFNRMRLENFRKDQKLGKDGAGPTTPPLQPLWLSTMRTIFGGGFWEKG